MDSAQVVDQQHVPWTNGPYERVLYCRAIQRELPQIIIEHFEDNPDIPFDQRSIQADAKSLEPEDARGYIGWLLGKDGLTEEAVEALAGTDWELAADPSATTGGSGSGGGGIGGSGGIQRGRYQSTIDRRYRDETIVRELKELYRNRCQVCGVCRQKGPAAGYSEAHHIKPLGAPHNGPDKHENLIVLCPNHHADFDYGAIEVDSESLELTHLYEDELTGATLGRHPEHEIDPTMLCYNNEKMSNLP